MTLFSDFSLPKSLIQKLSESGYVSPTEIQEKSLETLLAGHDVLASSQTGSGKTAAFVVPMIAKIMQAYEEKTGHVYGLILAPTRELAMQINEVVHKLCDGRIIHSAVIFGGSDIRKQMTALRRNPHIIIATPGRLRDHIARRSVDLSKFNVFVLDEFDRMLDMGFKEDIADISTRLMPERQTVMFSATTRKSVIDCAKKYLKNHKEIIIAPKHEKHENIVQDFVFVGSGAKYETLLAEIGKREGSILIFVNTKRSADDIMDRLRDDDIKAYAIHGDLRQRERERIISSFRDEKYRVLIATDVVARGIDIPHIRHVINYDTPRAFEDYTHRIGRTGRLGVEGFSLCFVTPGEKKFYNNIVSKVDSDEFQPFESRKRTAGAFGGGRGRDGGRSSGSDRGGRGFGGRERDGESPRGERRFPRNEDGPRYGRSSDGERPEGFRSEAPRSEGFRSDSPRREGDRHSSAERPASRWSRGDEGNREGSRERSYDAPRRPRSPSSRPASFGPKKYSKPSSSNT